VAEWPNAASTASSAANAECLGEREAERNTVWPHYTGSSNRHIHNPAGSEAFDASMVADLRCSVTVPFHPVPRRWRRGFRLR